jgi:hypothetical protein
MKAAEAIKRLVTLPPDALLPIDKWTIARRVHQSAAASDRASFE